MNADDRHGPRLAATNHADDEPAATAEIVVEVEMVEFDFVAGASRAERVVDL